MILNYKILKDSTIFEYQIESNHELSGMGETKMVTLLRPTGEVHFNYPVKNPHNDIMAFIILTIFKPFIKDIITFQFEISTHFINSLKKIPEYKNIKFNNTRIVNYPKFIGKEISIPVGGGMDSTAVMCLFKDTYLYHSTGKEIVNVNLLASKCGCKKKVDIVNSNIKEFIQPKTYTHWVSVFIGIYLLAQDQNLGYIFLGTMLEPNIITKNKFNKNFLKRKYGSGVRELSSDLGIYMINVFNGCSEIISTKIICSNNVDKYVVYCDKGNGNKKCNKCSKCLRKNTELSFFKDEYKVKDYKDYNIKNYVYNAKYLKSVYLYKNSSFYDNLLLKDFVDSNKNINVSWLDKIYTKAYRFYPKNIKSLIFKKIENYARHMNEEEIKSLENYDFSVNTETRDQMVIIIGISSGLLFVIISIILICKH